MEIRELKSRLHDRAESVIKHLLPQGKKSSGEWKVGSTAGDAGQSLSVRLTGDKAGVWSDFATGQSGDLIDLWRDVRGLSLVSALDEIRSYLGVEPHKFDKPLRESFTKPNRPQCSAPSGKMLEYLTHERGLTIETINTFKVGTTDTAIFFPFIKNDELTLVKYRPINGKPRPTEANCKPILFGWQSVPDDAREIVICEGEIDAMTMHQYGYPAVSVPFGAGSGGKHNWLAHEYNDLERFETIYLCMDNDGPGIEAADDLSQRLGKHRCKIVELPYKDVNECLKQGVTKSEVQEAIGNAKQIDPEELRRAGDFYDQVHKTFHPTTTAESGYSVPWEGFKELRFRPHEITLWTGASGAGKSQLLSHASVGFINQGAKICLASLEMTPAQSLKRMVKQAGNVDVPTDDHLHATLDWLDDNLWLYNHVGRTTVEKLLDGFEYARKRYGVDTFIIDSFMRLANISVDDYKAQSDAMFQLTDWAVNRPVHLHLVAHARKGQDSKDVPDIEAVKGTSEIGANAFLIIGVWRNRKLEDELIQAELSNDIDEVRRLKSMAGVKINIAKDRNGESEGKRPLSFDKRTFRYYSGQFDNTEYFKSHLSDVDLAQVGR